MFKTILRKILLRLDQYREPNGLVVKGVRLIGGGSPTVTVGDYTYINDAKLYCWRKGFNLIIGNYCSVAADVDIILGGEHDKEWVSTYPFFEKWGLEELRGQATSKCRGDIVVGSDVWIGHGVTILSGSTIGVGAIIAAGAVVRGVIPAYSIAAGVPARVIKARFSDEISQGLLATEWWNLTKDELMPYVQYLNDPEEFIRQASKFKSDC